MTNKELILVVDDDPQITSFLKRYLEKQEYRVICASDGREMQRKLAREAVDLCILDIGLPGKSGLDITRDIRATSNLPILVLSGRDETYDRVIGLEFGADDYMVKPFEPRELLARIRTILRRSKVARQQQDQTRSPSYQFGDWIFNYDERTLVNTVTGKPQIMTTTEIEILHVFVTNPNTVFSRNQLLDAARGRESFSGDRAIDVHIMRIRKKLTPDDPSAQGIINTIHGIGYSFTANVSMVDP
ncbi:MAG: response regulator transcription factor [Proteobacteria bacterium]|nr:response regulator transcription factor [Pseudomonadota bacterium]